MDFVVRHWIPGRIRLHVPALGTPGLDTGRIESWLKSFDHVREARINRSCANLIVEYDEAHRPLVRMMLGYLGTTTPKSLMEMVEAEPPAEETAIKQADHPPKPLDATVLALPTVSLALAFSGNPLALAVNIPLMLWNALPIAKRAWHIARHEKRLNVDFLDTLAIGASMVQGLAVTGGIITWLIRLGDWIRDMTAMGSKRAIAELMEFQGRTAWVVVEGAVIQVPVTQLKKDDLVIVYPGEVVPVDGEIVEGSAMVDQKTITGEGLPVSRAKGEQVFAATALREGQITVRAQRVGTETVAGQIAQLVDAAPIGDTRMQNHAERFADRLVVPTLSLATGTALLTADINRFLSLVIVDYGTGIRVAAPTSVLASITHAARSGIIIKSGGHMERLAEVDTIVFDKTGTLTHGVPEVVDVISFQNRIPTDHLIGLAAGVESRLSHPVAEALRTHAANRGVEILPCDTPDYHVGLGIEGQVNGHYVHLGSERYLRGQQIRIGASIARQKAELDESGNSCLFMAVDGKFAALIPYADKVRPESQQVMRRLKELGVRDTIMLTGDNATVAKAVGARVGLTRQFADMMPSDKADVIAQLKAEGRTVAMVGDGINDSVALTYSDVGIAMRHGAEIAHESAHIVLMEDSLWKLVHAVEISRGAVGLIKQNYGIVAVLNTLALGLALPSGLVSPTFTAVLSNGSAILASMNGMRPLLRG